MNTELPTAGRSRLVASDRTGRPWTTLIPISSPLLPSYRFSYRFRLPSAIRPNKVPPSRCQGWRSLTRPRVEEFEVATGDNYVIDLIFQAHLEGRDHGFTARNTPEAPPLDELRLAQQKLNDWYVAWSDGITLSALEEKVSFSFVGGGNGVMTRGEILQHLVTHTCYHRGYVAQMFLEVPVKAPTTDLTVFLRDVPLNLD